MAELISIGTPITVGIDVRGQGNTKDVFSTGAGATSFKLGTITTTDGGRSWTMNFVPGVSGATMQATLQRLPSESSISTLSPHFLINSQPFVQQGSNFAPAVESMDTPGTFLSQGQDAINKAETSLDKVNAANQLRFDTGISNLEALRDRSNTAIDTFGNQERSDINTQFARLGADTNQDLISRGLRNTTIAPSVQKGITGEKVKAFGRLGESLRRERFNTDLQTTSAIEGLRERRTDTATGLQLLPELLRQFGASGTL